MNDQYDIRVIGYVRSDIRSRLSAPRQGREAGVEAVLELHPEYLPALSGVEHHQRLNVVCWMHKAVRDKLQVHPKRDAQAPLTGVFATRSPARPNPLAIYTVENLGVEGTSLKVRGIDAVDGTPIVDIRPHIHRLDD